jgi:transcriptional regulator GlxA family with amidase domain
MAAVSLLSTFPHAVTSLPAELLLPRNRRMRTAVEFVHANAHLPITLTDIAASAALSARATQQAFERTLGTTPTRYLRTVRLERVRAELQAHRPEEITVGDVARRWGFLHLGRFSAAYAAAFGEYPRATLQR